MNLSFFAYSFNALSKDGLYASFLDFSWFCHSYDNTSKSLLYCFYFLTNDRTEYTQLLSCRQIDTLSSSLPDAVTAYCAMYESVFLRLFPELLSLSLHSLIICTWCLHRIRNPFGQYLSHSRDWELGNFDCLFLKHVASFNCFFKSCIHLTANVFSYVSQSDFLFLLRTWNHSAGALKQKPGDVNWKDAAFPHSCTGHVVLCCIFSLAFQSDHVSRYLLRCNLVYHFRLFPPATSISATASSCKRASCHHHQLHTLKY